VRTLQSILDDIAVLNSRYNFEINSITPIILSLSFPNIRTEYWKVINDIKKVFNIEINTITIGALMLMVWYQVTLPVIKSEFYTDIDSYSIRNQIENIITTKLEISDGCLGILEVTK